MRPRPSLTAVLALLLLFGCGAGAYDAHAFASQSLHDVSDGLRDVMRELHTDHLRAAVLGVDRHPGETDDAFNARRLAALEAADAQWRDDMADVISAQQAAAHASNAYSRAAFAGVQGQKPIGQVAAAGDDAIEALNAAIRAARRRGADVPEIPPEVATFLGHLIGPTAGGEATDGE